MTYLCRCEDGPAQGAEFREYGPPVSVDLPHEGQVLKYRLSNIQNDECVYQFAGCLEREESGDVSSIRNGACG